MDYRHKPLEWGPFWTPIGGPFWTPIDTTATRDVPVAVGWSRDGYTIRELAQELLALETVRAERAELNGDAVARREVNARIARVAADLEERVRQAFLFAEWKAASSSAYEATLTIPQDAGLAGLNAVASSLADSRYPHSPRLHNELLNRIKASSNAIAAQKALLKAMVDGLGQARLGIVGYPAHGGLYASLLEATGLYQAVTDARPARIGSPIHARVTRLNSGRCGRRPTISSDRPARRVRICATCSTCGRPLLMACATGCFAASGKRTECFSRPVEISLMVSRSANSTVGGSAIQSPPRKASM
jgi:hypothetical protein